MCAVTRLCITDINTMESSQCIKPWKHSAAECLTDSHWLERYLVSRGGRSKPTSIEPSNVEWLITMWNQLDCIRRPCLWRSVFGKSGVTLQSGWEIRRQFFSERQFKAIFCTEAKACQGSWWLATASSTCVETARPGDLPIGPGTKALQRVRALGQCQWAR